MPSFTDVQQQALTFRDARDWSQFHNPKDLAISISLEAAELLECFQWSGTNLDPEETKASIKDELADVLIYCIYLANVEGIDIPQAIQDKIRKNEAHYPVDKSFGNAAKYTEL